MSRRIANLLLWVGASIGALSIVATLLVALLGYVPLVFTSGSMSPDIPAGSLGVAKTVPASAVEVGDVVSVDSAEGARVTHRVLEIAPGGGDDAAVLTLKGDANEAADADPYVVTEVDRVMFSVPVVGRVLSWLASPIALFVGGVVAAGVVFWIISSRRGPGPGPGDRRGGSRRNSDVSGGGRRRTGAARQVAAVVASVAVPAVLLVAPAQPTAAAFNDLGGTVTTSGFVSHRVAQPTSIGCTVAPAALPTNLTISTVSTNPIYTYWVRIFDAAGNPLTVERQMTGTGTNRAYTYALLSGDLPLLGAGITYYARVYARIAGTTWTSIDYQSRPISKTLSFVSCGTADPSPVISFSAPTDGMTRTRFQMGTTVSACNTLFRSAAACGFATDNGSVTSVEYILQRTASSAGTRCWNGSSWVSDCSYRSADRDGTFWWVPVYSLLFPNPYTSDGTYFLTIRATDNVGLVTVSTIRFVVTS